MHLLKTLSTALCVGLLALTGCDGSAPVETTGTPAPAPAPAPADAVGGDVPSSLFVSSEPAGAEPLIDAKSSASAGERISFTARVGGRRDAFVDGRAIFFVADPALLSCDQLHGDTCKTPWDYCCEPRDNLLKNMATVQVVDENGQPLRVSLEDREGLAPLKTVVVSGTVDQIDESGVLVVNADSIYIKEG